MDIVKFGMARFIRHLVNSVDDSNEAFAVIHKDSEIMQEAKATLQAYDQSTSQEERDRNPIY